MSHLPLPDRDVERVLAGQQPYGHPDFADVAYFMARLRASVDFESIPEMSPELRAQVEAAEARQAQRASGRRRRYGRPSVPARVPENAVGVIRLETRRSPAGTSRRWHLVAAAAAVLVGAVATVSLTFGGGSRPEVDAGTARPASESTRTSDDATTNDTESEPPAASSGDPGSRPTVPSQPPDTQVDTTAVPTTPTSEANAPDAEGVPHWAEDWWPSECEWRDWECGCEQLGSGRERAQCYELAEDFSEQGSSSGGGWP